MGSLRPQVVLFGDSLTEMSVQAANSGWGASLANYYSRKADVVVRGFGGYNTRWALVVLDKIFPTPSSNPPLLVTVFFGANDAAVPDADHVWLHVPLQEYRENLHQIVDRLKTQVGCAHVVLIAPPPIDEKNLLHFAPIMLGDASGVPTRLNEVTKTYAEECVKVGQEKGVPVINLWSIFQEASDWESKYLSDGLHLSAEGNAKLYEELLKITDKEGLAPPLKPDELKFDLPWFMELRTNPIEVLKASGPCSETKI